MTTPSSCKSFFKQYLFYKLRTQSITFVVSALLNLLTLPLLATDFLSYHASRSNYGYNGVPDTIYYFGVIILFVLAITGGARAFRSCVKKDCVDTLEALPLNRREHFFGDFLSGYIANVGPFFPCAVITMILSIPADKAFNNNLIENKCPTAYGVIVTWLFVLILILFLLYTLSYILSVFVTVCCGKMSSSIIFTTIISTLIMIAGLGIGSYAEQCVTGYNPYRSVYVNYIPPFGLLRFAYDVFYFPSNLDWSNPVKYNLFPSAWGIILLFTAGAVGIYTAYRIFKERQAERTGKIIASNAIYKTICALSVIAITSVSISALYIFRLTWLAILISLVIIAVLVLVLEAFRGLKKAGFIITGTRCLITMSVCVIALVIVDKTGVFGVRYINQSPTDIKRITIQSNNGNSYNNFLMHGYYTVRSTSIALDFFDQKDIEKFLELHNKTLKQHSNELTEGNDFLLSIQLKNGETIYRSYKANSRIWNVDNADEAIDELDNNFHSLPSYNFKASEILSNKLLEINSMKVEIKDTFGDVEIPVENLHELYKIFTREYEEKFTPSDTVAGIFIYESNEYKELSTIDIPSSCTETLEYVNSLRGDNSERTALTIKISRNGANIKCPITVKETQTELGRELMSLLSDKYTAVKYGYMRTVEVYSSDLNKYYINTENYNRVFEIAMQFIEEKYSAEA